MMSGTGIGSFGRANSVEELLSGGVEFMARPKGMTRNFLKVKKLRNNSSTFVNKREKSRK